MTIGRQDLFVDAEMLAGAYADAGMQIDLALAEQLVREGGGYAEALLKHMGAREVESLDASDYEHATHVHDLNTPLPTTSQADTAS